LARKRPQKRRTSQILFIILSVLVVLSMAIGYALTALPAPTPPTPTPAAIQTPVVLLINTMV
jgi:thiol:disulfide interchange protein